MLLLDVQITASASYCYDGFALSLRPKRRRYGFYVMEQSFLWSSAKDIKKRTRNGMSKQRSEEYQVNDVSGKHSFWGTLKHTGEHSPPE